MTLPLCLLDSVSLAYQRVQKVDCTSLRPVLILGPLLDVVKEMLVNEAPGKFCRCPLGKRCPSLCPLGVSVPIYLSFWPCRVIAMQSLRILLMCTDPACGSLFWTREQIAVWVSMLIISCSVCIGALLCTQHLDFCILPYRGDEGLPASH